MFHKGQVAYWVGLPANMLYFENSQFYDPIKGLTGIKWAKTLRRMGKWDP